MAGTLTISTLSDGTNSTSSTNCIQGSAKAWVNFNGTGTVAIRASYNVSSITDNGTGDYTVNFTNPMSDTNYSFFGQTRRESAGFGENSLVPGSTDTKTVSALQVRTGYGTTQVDYPEINVSVFR